MEVQLFLAVVIGIAILLFLILKLRIHAFVALLIGSIVVGLIAGLDANQIISTIQKGMGGTLGFVATVVGLGAIFGGILEASGGAKAIADFMVSKFGLKKAPAAMVVSGFLIAIPVFFDVAFIILVPMMYALQRRTGKSLLLYAIPLLAGLAITHAFIPPTPGPIAVADIIDVDLGWVILMGFIAGIPTALIAGLWFGRHISKKIFVAAPEEIEDGTTPNLPPIGQTLMIIGLPIILILLNTMVTAGTFGITSTTVLQLIALVGHPFSALIIANLLAWYFFGLKKGFTKDQLLKISTKSLAPAGTIILLTGAGGVFKQVLTDTGAGELLANSLSNAGIPVLAFAFISAAIVRIVQGSSTVAMITAAGLVSPLLANAELNPMQLACMVIAIASGASIFSHVNDSGFWLVGQYLGITEKQTFRSWTVMTTILAFVGMLTVSLVYIFA
ncbi:MAG: gluconate transporter [Muricauda sp.]|jgi:Gnt-I system low-affinity gluconate transporter|uniref:GntP family permease n=1 Tax=Allomuricauda sp. ARW1Y1 TaxID=2663843 RepID=UPI0015C7861A|nr:MULTISPECIES: gluconate:H+ symporter [unclassified Allomuricauda]MBO6589102.1 gluconate transporter [Allomuricauda sp.]MBO6618727.1 gluconate transporter [Allomuricauda sp.]MBO6644640.1 gluconate transporter [Allomuricauda sp.]MBO6746540.1 gluconate transporter [Allomuricauda sp.]MBO6843376.1 gluconate transporter [Allomuricauda sp.]